MKTVSGGLGTHVQQQVTTLATCWKITRKDGNIFAFTDFDKDLTIGGIVYLSSTGYSRTAIASNSNLSVDNLNVDGMLDSNNITDADVRAAKFDYADVEIFAVNWSDLTQGILKLRKGTFGEVSLGDLSYTTELRGLSQAFANKCGQICTPTCRAVLGDTKCKVDLTPFTFTGTVATQAGNRKQFTVSGPAAAKPANYFYGGVITWLTGLNANRKMEVRLWDGAGNITLFLPMTDPIVVGDTFSLVAGCDHKLSTCIGTFNNVVNFRGEPYVPGLTSIMQYPSSNGV